MYIYRTQGVCSRAIHIELDGDVVKSVEFEGGCSGNLKAISKLIAGKTVDEVTEDFEGLTCGPRPTSCADQLVKGLHEAQKESNKPNAALSSTREHVRRREGADETTCSP